MGFWGQHNFDCKHIAAPPVFDKIDLACISVRELWPVVAAFKHTGHIWAHSGVLLSTDNTQVISMVVTGCSRNIQALGVILGLCSS